MQTVTSRIAALLGGKGYPKCESPSLRLEKFVHITPEDKAERARELASVVACHNQHAGKPVMAWGDQRGCEVVAHLKGNLIVNQSGGILENAGLCLDPFRGYPYIPGSAVKGVASHAAFQEWKDGSRTPDVANRIADVFGFPTGHRELDDKLREWNDWDKNDARSGKVSFLPAVPNPDSNAPKCQLTLDIATPHHPEYYQGKRTEATDDEEPIPLTFPVVKAGAEFLFRIVPLNGATDKVLEDAQKWLLQALAVFGLGAKTAAGMGWFEDVTQKRLEERKALAERQKEQAAQQAQAQQVRDAEARRAQDNKDFEERLARLSPAERAFEKMRNEYPNTDKLMGGMEKLASPKCTWTDDDKKAFIRLVKEGFPPYWTNTLKPLINRKPKKGEQRLKQLAMALVQTDLNMHGKEGRLLK